ncbi:MAG: hypothetical protein WC477_06290 [Patescibacteria group bacterium]
MARLNVLLTGYEITDYLFRRTSSAALALDHDTIRGTADLEIWTGAGGTGTQLALTTDYTVSDEDTELSTEAGVSIYTKLAIVNGTYHNVDLYATYKTIGDYNSTTSVRLVQIGLKEITGNYTVTADDHTIIVNTASAVTITIPDGLPQGFDLCISRTLASTASVTVAMSGSETVEGASSFVTHGAFAASTMNDAEVTIRKKTTTDWRFVGGEITGSNGNGSYKYTSNGELRQRGTATGTTDSLVNNNTGTYGWSLYIKTVAVTLPVPYESSSSYKLISMSTNAGGGISFANFYSKTESGFVVILNTATSLADIVCDWEVVGRWK